MKGTISFFYNNEIVHNALIPVPTKGTIISFLPVVVMWSILIPVPTKGTIIITLLIIDPTNYFNPHTHKGYDSCIGRVDSNGYALIPVPVKGTIKNIIFRSINKRILISVPVKGTIRLWLHQKFCL